MKRYYILFVVILTIIPLLLSSCEDSLGIEGNYKKVYFDDDGNGNGNNEPPVDSLVKKINPKEIITNFTESVYYKDLGFSENHQFMPKEIDLESIEIDTSKSIPTIWINSLYIENKATSGSYESMGRKEYVKAIQIKLDSIKAEGFYYLSGDFSSNLYSELQVYDIVSNRTIAYSGRETKLNIIFEMISKERIQVNLSATLPSTNEDDVEINFYGFFILVYDK
jgi:hypothetical protein